MSLNTSESCATIPAVQAHGYQAKGKYETHAGLKTYITGNHDADKAIFLIYDIFGLTDQTLQGADILAHSGKYLVFVPDFFKGEPIKMEWYANPTEENTAKKNKFMQNLSFDKEDDVLSTLNELKKSFPKVKTWGAIGYCWGGKLVALTAKQNTPWKVAVQSSPAKMDAEDAKQLTIPFGTLASQGEAQDVVDAFDKAQTTPKMVHRFHDRVHGFMSARSNLKEDEELKAYEKGYQLAIDFFDKHM